MGESAGEAEVVLTKDRRKAGLTRVRVRVSVARMQAAPPSPSLGVCALRPACF